MNKILLLSIFLILISSCTVTRQFYAFQHHGTESIKTDSDFRYVARNVMGKAKSTIKLSAWKKMRQDLVSDGLLADAKSQLPPLQDNQAFANLSIDNLTTHTGSSIPGGGVSVREIVIEVIVSADIIEYYKN